MSSGAARAPHSRDARTRASGHEDARRSRDDARGLAVSRRGLGQDQLVQRQIRYRLAQSPVLRFQLFQSLHLIALEPAELLPPAVVRHLSHADLTGSHRPYSPRETSHITCRSFATISSGLYLFLGISVLLEAKSHRSSRTTQCGLLSGADHRATVDVPARFRKSKAVGAVFGLTCSSMKSGEIERSGRISRCGDEMMRVMLYEAAQSMLRSKKWSWLKAWAMQIARRRGMKVIVALARRLAVIMHRIWVDGTEFRWTREAVAA